MCSVLIFHHYLRSKVPNFLAGEGEKNDAGFALKTGVWPCFTDRRLTAKSCSGVAAELMDRTSLRVMFLLLLSLSPLLLLTFRSVFPRLLY